MKMEELFENRVILKEMALLKKSKTGLSIDMWIGSTGGRHSFRLKVSNNSTKFDKDDNFSIRLNPKPTIIEKHDVKISASLIQDIKDWIDNNQTILQALEIAYEGNGSANLMLNGKKN